MKRIFPLICAFSLVLFIYSATAHAATTSFSLTAAELAAPQIVRSGVSLLIPATATANLPSTGTASSAGISRTMIARVGGFKGIATVGIVAIAGYAAWVETHPQQNPIAFKLLHPDSVTSYPDVLTDGHTYRILPNWWLISYSPYTGQTPYQTVATYPATSIVVAKKSTVTNNFDVYGVPIAWDSPTPAVDSATFAQSLANIYPTALPEIDNYIQSNPESVQLPSSIPLDIYKLLYSDGLASQNDADAKRVEALNSVKNAAQTAYDADPSPLNKIALDKSVADYNEAVADSASKDIQAADNDAVGPPPVPAYDKLNFQPLQDMGDELSNKFPFSLLTTLKNFAQGLVASPEAPSFTIDFPAPFSFQWVVSLEKFDNIARMVRVLIGMGFLAYITMSLLRRFH